MTESFGDWLSEQLHRRGWSHNELARRAGVSQPAISGIIAGRRPSADSCIKIANALEESSIRLLQLAGILPDASEDAMLQQLIELARNLPDEDKQQILEYVKFIYQQRKR